MSHFVSEFLGTAVLVLLGNAIVAAVALTRTRAHGTGWPAVALGWGAALTIGAWIAAPSGAHLNPAVTIALACAGLVDPATLGSHVIAQLLGALVGALVTAVVFLPHWRLTEDSSRVLACFCSVPAVRAPLSNFLAETVGMFLFVLGVFAIAGHPWTPPEVYAPGMEGLALEDPSWRAAWWQFAGAVGLMLAIVLFSLGATMGGAMNPARDLSSRLVHALLPLPGKGPSDWGYAWVPVAGPILGALAGVMVAGMAGLR